METKRTVIRGTLQKGEVIRLAEGARLEIECESGSVWMTQDGDRRDIVLASGERHRWGDARPVLVEALKTSRFAVSVPVRVAAPRPARGPVQRLVEALDARIAGRRLAYE